MLVVQGEAETLVRLVAAGDAVARDRLLALHYAELKRIARRVVGGDAARLELQPTELLHEASMKLMRLDRLEWRDRAHFFATAARVMRQVLIDQVRRARASKRNDGFGPITMLPGETRGFDLLALDAALERLTAISAEKGRIVELRVFAGLSVEEAAEAMGVSPSTVKRGWRVARAWLYDALDGVEADGTRL